MDDNEKMNSDELKEPSKHILTRINDVVNDLENAKLEDVSELLDYYNGKPVIIDGMAYHPFNDPVFAAKINARYYELTGENHPTFVEQSPKLIDGLMQDKDMLLKSGAYPPEYFDQLNEIKDNLNIEPNIELNNEDKIENVDTVDDPVLDSDDNTIDEDEMDFEDPNIIDAEDYTITDKESLLDKTAEYAKLKAKNVTEQSKNLVYDTAHNVKRRILNTAPFRIARSVRRVGKKIFKGFKTAGMLTIGVGAISVDAVKKAKETIDRASSSSIRDSVNNMRDSASQTLDKAIERLEAQSKQFEEMQNQHTYQFETDGR